MHNPNNKQQVAGLLLLIIGSFLIGIIVGYVFGYGSNDQFPIILGWIMAILWCAFLVETLIEKELIKRPRFVELLSSGIMLTSRLGSERFVPWEGIRYVAIDHRPEEEWHGKIYHDAKLKMFNGSVVFVTQDIGMAVKKAYEKATGRSMPQIHWGSHEP
jgi:hypothetical protein